MRKLASLRLIEEIKPIEKADAIEAARVGGWWVVVKKGEYKVGDLVVYLEVDSWVPTQIADFLSKGKEPKVFNGVQGERLRTIKLRGQISQGLILPTTILGKAVGFETDVDYRALWNESSDLTETLGIQKWEKPVPTQLAGKMKGSFPSFIPKTDQERVQNLVKEIATAMESGLEFEVTEKLEGSSMTVYVTTEEHEDGPRRVFGVCSRNIDLLRDEDNTYWKAALKYDLENKMTPDNESFAIQGEIVGPGIEGNIYGLTEVEFWVYDIYNIKAGCYYQPGLCRAICAMLGLNHVPVIETYQKLSNVDELLVIADGPSQLPTRKKETLREGLVYKQVNGGMTFKTISNKYLLNEQ